MEHCSEENTTDLVSAITICLPHLEELNILDSIESPRKPPEQHDYLKQMKSLKRIRLSPGCLAPDSLMHIGPALEDVTLYGQVLQAAELGFSLAIMEPACEMRISLWHSEYPLKDRSYLQVSLLILLVSCAEETYRLFALEKLGSSSLSGIDAAVSSYGGVTPSARRSTMGHLIACEGDIKVWEAGRLSCTMIPCHSCIQYL